MLRYLVYFRYGMMARKHPYRDHVATEQEAFARRLSRANPFQAAGSAGTVSETMHDDAPLAFRLAAE